jgi:hypothetical protein
MFFKIIYTFVLLHTPYDKGKRKQTIHNGGKAEHLHRGGYCEV